MCNVINPLKALTWCYRANTNNPFYFIILLQHVIGNSYFNFSNTFLCASKHIMLAIFCDCNIKLNVVCIQMKWQVQVMNNLWNWLDTRTVQSRPKHRNQLCAPPLIPYMSCKRDSKIWCLIVSSTAERFNINRTIAFKAESTSFLTYNKVVSIECKGW